MRKSAFVAALSNNFAVLLLLRHARTIFPLAAVRHALISLRSLLDIRTLLLILSSEERIALMIRPFTARGILFTLLASGSALTLYAQEPPAQAPATDAAKPAPVAATVPPAAQAPALPAGPLVLKEGSDIHLKFAQNLSSKTAAEGDTVNLVLDEDLKVGDVVVAKAGSKVVGTITHAKKAGMIGKAGELNMRLEYLILPDGRLRLRGSKGKEGEGKEGTAVALTVLFGPIGLIKHGKEVEIKEGTPLPAYTDENYTVPVAK